VSARGILPPRDYRSRGGLPPFLLGRKSPLGEGGGRGRGFRTSRPSFRHRFVRERGHAPHLIRSIHSTIRAACTGYRRAEVILTPRVATFWRAPVNFYRYAFSPWNGRISIRRGETARRICMILYARLKQSIPRTRARAREFSFLRGRGGSRRAGRSAEAQSDIAIVGSCTPPGSVNLN